MLVHLVPSPEQIPSLDPLRSRSLFANDLFVHGRQDKVVQHVLHPGQNSETLLGSPSHAICKRRVKKRAAAASASPMILPTGHTTWPLVPVEHWMDPSFARMIVLFMPFARALALVGSWSEQNRTGGHGQKRLLLRTAMGGESRLPQRQAFPEWPRTSPPSFAFEGLIRPLSLAHCRSQDLPSGCAVGDRGHEGDNKLTGD
jgi:hypothetical protein